MTAPSSSEQPFSEDRQHLAGLPAFWQFFRAAPPEVDIEAIWREWTALQPPYRVEERRLPMPVWARRGFSETGAQAWEVLRRDVASMDPGKAFCIYVHVPFCAGRCAFCDCYSFPLRRHEAREIDHYLALLDQEVCLWSRLGTLGRRPVSTVHLGGGTPTFLGEGPFGRLVQSLGQRFNVSPHTEWALESTSSELTADMVSRLEALGFTRLHVGVQTLQDPVRQAIGRREPAATVLDKIARAVGLGWVVSVDLILGLPGQTLAGVLGDVRALEAAGVDGFSLYELQLSSRNRRFAEQNGLLERGRLDAYFLLQAASRCLASLGYRKTLFNHFARARDTNLYFTFPARGEDCLALGTIADGVFGDYHYRHPAYRAYGQLVSGPAPGRHASPGLQGGLRRNAAENHLQPLEVALLSAHLPVALFADRLGQARAQELFHRWRASALIEDDDGQGYRGTGSVRLTANGSWFTGMMMEQLT